MLERQATANQGRTAPAAKLQRNRNRKAGTDPGVCQILVFYISRRKGIFDILKRFLKIRQFIKNLINVLKDETMKLAVIENFLCMKGDTPQKR